MSVVIIDNGGANLASVINAFERLGVSPVPSSDPAVMESAERLVLPGVGAAGDGMRRLRAQRLHDRVPQLEQPLLGICLGMQLMFERSEENDTQCLGLLDGTVRQLHENADVTVPHMGWNRLSMQVEHPVMRGVSEKDWFYFVHSFAALSTKDAVASCRHGMQFTAVAARGNFIGVQFHPERSGEAGARVLKNFLEWDGCN